MAQLRRVRTISTGVAGSPFYTNMYFTRVDGEADDAQAGVGLFWTVMDGIQQNNLERVVEAEQAIVDDTTGEIVAVENATAPLISSGSGLGEPLPAYCQGLVRWNTDTFIGGRRLLGRTFVPAMLESFNDGGNVAALAVTAMQDATTELLAASASFGPLRVFSKTKLTSAVVTSASAAAGWSVLRSRRGLL